MLAQKNVDSKYRALVAGGCASLVGQTIIVPFDVLSQHLMMIGTVQKDNVSVFPKHLVIRVMVCWFVSIFRLHLTP